MSPQSPIRSARLVLGAGAQFLIERAILNDGNVVASGTQPPRDAFQHLDADQVQRALTAVGSGVVNVARVTIG